MVDIRCILDAKAQLGESTFWDAAADVLWWVDIFGHTIHRFDPSRATDDVFEAPEPLGCLAVRARGGLVVSLRSGFAFFDPDTGRYEPIHDPEAHLSETRFNDGKTDRQGRFWSGTVFEAPGKPSASIGALYRLNADLSCHRLIDGVGCANGLAWSPDSRTMYFADSRTPHVWAYDFDPDTGDIAGRRTFIDLSDIEAFVDGATVDAGGCYWTTIPHRGQLRRYDPSGKLMQKIDMPTDMPTCCEFGGKNLDTLFVTTAVFNRSPTELAGQTHAGGLFAITETGATGLPLPPFLG